MTTVFLNIVVMLLYMGVGYFLSKIKKADAAHMKTMSGLLMYVSAPCLLLSSFQKMEYSLENFGMSLLFCGVTLVLMVVFFLLLYLIFRKKFHDARYRVMAGGAIFGNVGFFGLPLVTALFPDEPLVACYSTLFTLSLNLLIFTLGIYAVTKDKKYMSLKNATILNPVFIAAIVAFALYLLRIKMPSLIAEPIDMLGKMCTPLCMVVLGVRLASMSFKDIFASHYTYMACVLKLIVFPLFSYACVAFLPLPDTFKYSILVLSATPAATGFLSMAEIHGCEQKLVANTLLMTSLVSVITLPLLMLILG